MSESKSSQHGQDNIAVEEIDQREWKPSRQVYLIMAGLVCVMFVVALDSTILSTSLPVLANALNASAVQAYWIAAAYLLASAVVQPILAALADIFGRRASFLGSIAMFTIGSLVCCLARNIAMMLAGRTIQGIGGGGILSINLIILSDILPLRQRSKYVGIITLFNSIGVNIGPVVGAALVKSSWRWLFYINFPFCGIGLIVTPFLLRYAHSQETSYQKLGQVDWLGSGLFMIGCAAFLVGLSWGGNQYAWNTAATLVPLLMGLGLVAIVILYERFLTARPFLRLSLFRNRTAWAVYLGTLLQALTLFCEVYFIALSLIAVKLYTPLHSAALLLAFAFFVVPVSGVVGVLIARAGSYRYFIMVGWIVNTAGLGVLMLLDRTTSTVSLVFILLFAGLGQGILFISQQIATQAACDVDDVAYAAAMFSFVRSLGFCLGISIGGTVLQNVLRHRLSQSELPVEIAANAEAFASQLRSLPPSNMLDGIVDAYAWAFRMLFATMTGISGLGLLVNFLVKHYSLNQNLSSRHKLRSAES